MALSLNLDRHFHSYLILCAALLSLISTLWMYPIIFGKSLNASQLDHVILLPLFLAVMLSNMQMRIPKYWIMIIVFAIVYLLIILLGYLRADYNSLAFQLPMQFFFVTLIPMETDYIFSGIKLTPPEKALYKERVLKSSTNFLSILFVLGIDHKIARSWWKMNPSSVVVADFVGLFLTAFILLLFYRLFYSRSKFIYSTASVLTVACSTIIIALGSTYL